jgi:hypothetical protein
MVRNVSAPSSSSPGSVYEHVGRMRELLPFPLHTVRGGNLYEDMMAGLNSTGQRWAAIPWFLAPAKPGDRPVMGRRQCTAEYKIDPLKRAQRALMGHQPRDRIPRGACEIWIGISTDEAHRMKPARVQWQTNRWPLIELGMSRSDCLAWLKRNSNWEPTKSSCSFCPYRSDAGWALLKRTEPAAFEQACQVDEAMRTDAARHRLRLKAAPYLHRSLTPLREVKFDPLSRDGQADLFGNECDGMCGT